MTIYQVILIEKYLHKLKRLLAYPAVERKGIIKDYREFIYRNVRCGEVILSMKDLYAQYGTEVTVSQNLMSMITDTEREQYSKEMISKKFILRFFTISFVIVTFFVLPLYLLASIIQKIALNMNVEMYRQR